jgi:hypothetical protein
MVSEIIWILIGIVWLTISIYIAFLIFKYGSKIMKGLVGLKGTPDVSKMLNELQKFNRQIKK